MSRSYIGVGRGIICACAHHIRVRSAWCSWRAMASDREAEEVRQTENRSGVCRIRDLLVQAVRCLDNPSEAAAGSVPGRGRGHVLPGSTLSGSTVVQPASNASSLIARSTSSRASSSFGTASSSSRLISERNLSLQLWSEFALEETWKCSRLRGEMEEETRRDVGARLHLPQQDQPSEDANCHGEVQDYQCRCD